MDDLQLAIERLMAARRRGSCALSFELSAGRIATRVGPARARARGRAADHERSPGTLTLGHPVDRRGLGVEQPDAGHIVVRLGKWWRRS